MIDSLVKLWPVISGTALAFWAVLTLVVKRWTRKRDTEAKRKATAEDLAQKAIDTARAQADAAISAHMHSLEQTITQQSAELLRINSALEVAHESEVEAWKRYRAASGTPEAPKENP